MAKILLTFPKDARIENMYHSQLFETSEHLTNWLEENNDKLHDVEIDLKKKTLKFAKVKGDGIKMSASLVEVPDNYVQKNDE